MNSRDRNEKRSKKRRIKMFKIRNEIETDYKIVEDVTRKAFYIMSHSFVE